MFSCLEVAISSQHRFSLRKAVGPLPTGEPSREGRCFGSLVSRQEPALGSLHGLVTTDPIHLTGFKTETEGPPHKSQSASPSQLLGRLSVQHLPSRRPMRAGHLLPCWEDSGGGRPVTGVGGPLAAGAAESGAAGERRQSGRREEGAASCLARGGTGSARGGSEAGLGRCGRRSLGGGGTGFLSTTRCGDGDSVARTEGRGGGDGPGGPCGQGPQDARGTLSEPGAARRAPGTVRAGRAGPVARSPGRQRRVRCRQTAVPVVLF